MVIIKFSLGLEMISLALFRRMIQIWKISEEQNNIVQQFEVNLNGKTPISNVGARMK